MSQIQKIEGSEITYPYYPGNSKCVYCEGSYSVHPTKFAVHLKNGQVIKPVCCVCITENILAHPQEIETIENIGE